MLGYAGSTYRVSWAGWLRGGLGLSRNQTILNMITFAGAVALVGAMLQSGIELYAEADTGIDRVSVTRFASPSRLGSLTRPSEQRGTRAADLSVIVRANRSSAITVAPGVEVHYEVVGELSDDANEGLAFLHFDLEFDGGDLPQADTPTDPPMSSFVIPDGYTNPAGFGGTVDVPGRVGDLVQVGGCQNTIKNTADNAPYPIGSVITGIAWPGSPEVLVTGTLTAPAAQGTYTLQLTNLASRVIKQGEAGVPFWETVSAGLGTVTSLTIAVSPFKDCNRNGIPDECDIDCGPLGGLCDVPGCGISEDDDSDGIPDECEATAQLTLSADDVYYGWVEPDNTVTISVDLTAATATVVGGDFFLKYDNTVLDFVSMVPGDPPFTLEILEVVDEGAGTIDYGVGIDSGDTGTADDSTMAVITFAIVAEVYDTANLVWFNQLHAPPTKLIGEAGHQIDPTLVDLSAITIDSEDNGASQPSAPDTCGACGSGAVVGGVVMLIGLLSLRLCSRRPRP